MESHASKYHSGFILYQGLYSTTILTTMDREALSTSWHLLLGRVRGLDKSGSPIGAFSDAEKFTVSLAAGSYAATLGDSTTHGGGDMIYSPANVECDYANLSFIPEL